MTANFILPKIGQPTLVISYRYIVARAGALPLPDGSTIALDFDGLVQLRRAWDMPALAAQIAQTERDLLAEAATAEAEKTRRRCKQQLVEVAEAECSSAAAARLNLLLECRDLLTVFAVTLGLSVVPVINKIYVE